MSAILHQQLRKTALKTALIHILKNKSKSPERTARNILELLSKFNPEAIPLPYGYEELILMVKTMATEDCICKILEKTA